MAVQDDEDPQLSGEGEPQSEKVSSGKIIPNQESQTRYRKMSRTRLRTKTRNMAMTKSTG